MNPRIREAPPVIEAETTIPTRHGPFRLLLFRHPADRDEEQLAMVRGDVRGSEVLVRVHSECLTSEVFGSLKCDCAEQLGRALSAIAAAERGVLIYLRQEGRGIGLANKLRAYALQARGLDTVDANRALGLPDDARDYRAAAALLDWLGVTSVRLLTNNPDKQHQLAALGIAVEQIVPVHVPANPHSAAYLRAKRERMGHLRPPVMPVGMHSNDNRERKAT